MDAFLLAFAVVFLAELGDKTQLVALSLATRYRTITVLAGITVAYAITNGISVIVGGLLGAALPTTAIAIGGAIAFFGFAIWTLRGDDDEDDTRLVGGRSVRPTHLRREELPELLPELLPTEVPAANVVSGSTQANDLVISLRRAHTWRCPRRALWEVDPVAHP